MRAGRLTAFALVLALGACARGEPDLLTPARGGDGPDEFAILPNAPLQAPEDYAALPPPTPGGANRTDRTPLADAAVALGGRPGAAGAVPARDAGLVGYAARGGVARDIRGTLATEDLAFRDRNRGRVLERLVGNNTYYRAYRRQSLDQYAELERFRRAGVRTPAAPPDSVGGRPPINPNALRDSSDVALSSNRIRR